MTYQNIISLSHAEASLLTTLAASGKRIFATKDGSDAIGEGRSATDILARLVAKGWLERIEKGKYLIVPLEAGPDLTWTEDAHVIAGHLVSPGMVSYWPSVTGTSPNRYPASPACRRRPERRTAGRGSSGCGSGSFA